MLNTERLRIENMSIGHTKENAQQHGRAMITVDSELPGAKRVRVSFMSSVTSLVLHVADPPQNHTKKRGYSKLIPAFVGFP